MSRGYAAQTYHSPRVILHAVEDPQTLYLPGGGWLDSAARYRGETIIPAGTPIAQDPSGGAHLPWKGTLANGAGTASTALVVDDASFYSVGDAIYVGGSDRTVAAVDYATNAITLNSAATWADNSLVVPTSTYAAQNLCVGFVSDEYGVKLADRHGNVEGKPFRLLTGGRVKADMVFNLDALAAQILAGTQKFSNDLQIWRGDTRVA